MSHQIVIELPPQVPIHSHQRQTVALTSKRVFTTVIGRTVQAAKARADAPMQRACNGPRLPLALLQVTRERG